MSTKRRFSIAKEGKSPSKEAMSRTYNRAIANGGVTQDFNANVENIREIDRKMGVNILPSITTRNLLKYSEDYTQSVWSKDRATITPNQIANPINGLVNASLLTIDTSNNTHRILYNAGTLTLTNSTISVYLKKNTTNLIQLNASNSPQFINFDLNLGTVVNAGSGVVSSSIESLSGGWYRCIVTFTSITTSTISVLFIQNASDTWRPGFLGNGTDSIYVWGAQLEENTGATTYQPTKETQTNLELTSANFLYVPSSYGEGKNFTQNPSIRNLNKVSEDFDSGFWAKNNFTPVLTANLNPFGINKSYYLTDNAASTSHTITQAYQIYTNITYTSSYYVKKAVHSWIQFVAPSGFGNIVWANFNFDTGLFGNKGSGATVKATSIANGYWRIDLTGKSVQTALRSPAAIYSTNDTDSATVAVVYLGTGVNVVEVAAIQTEVGVTATSYQRTTDGISDFMFTRATSSRTTNKLGIIEDSAYNLLQRSEEFDNAAWSKVEATVTANATLAPNGTMTAESVIPTVVASHHRVVQTLTPVVVGDIYNLSVYAKPNGYDYIWLGITPAGSGGTFFNLSNGTFITQGTNVISSKIEAAENGFYRCSISIAAQLTNLPFDLYVRQSVSFAQVPGDGVSGVYIWGAQVEKNSASRPYLKTTDRLNVPCLDYSRSLLEPSLMIEPQRTNLLLQSGNLSSGWTATRGTINANTILNPFGIGNGYYFTEDDTSNTRIISRSGLSFTTGSTYTTSYYVKKADDSWIQLVYVSAAFGLNVWVNFNFDTGLFGNNGGTGSWTARQLTSGYWLLTLTATATATTSDAAGIIAGANNTNTATRIPSYLGVFRNVVNIAAIQLEVGSNATSYIPTTTATVQRNRDSNYVDLSNNNMLNKDNFTLYCEGWLYEGESSNTSIALSDSTRTGAFGNDLGWYLGVRPIYSIGGVVTNPGGTVPLIANNSYKFVIQRIGDQVRFFRNGIEIWSVQTIPVVDYKYLTVNGISTYSVDKIALFNRSLSFVECINLSSPTYTFEEMVDVNNYTLIL